MRPESSVKFGSRTPRPTSIRESRSSKVTPDSSCLPHRRPSVPAISSRALMNTRKPFKNARSLPKECRLHGLKRTGLTPGFPALLTEIATAMASQTCSNGSMARNRPTGFLNPSNRECLYEKEADVFRCVAELPPSCAKLPLRFRRQRLRRPRLQLRANRLTCIGDNRPNRPFSEVSRFASGLPPNRQSHSKSLDH
jgi:hypothetical protein